MFIKVLNKRYPLGRQEKSVINDLQSLLSKDLGVAERRIVAILCDDTITDKHKATAADIFGIEECDVTAKQREIGRQRNFFIAYGER
jgi:hypothetical protein